METVIPQEEEKKEEIKVEKFELVKQISRGSYSEVWLSRFIMQG